MRSRPTRHRFCNKKKRCANRQVLAPWSRRPTMDYLAHPIVPPSGPTHSYKQVKRAAFSQCWRIFKMACGKAPQERTYGICRTASSGIRTARAATSATTSPAPWWIRAATTEAKTARRGGTKVGRGSRSISMTLSAGSLPVPRGAEGASSTCSRTPGGEIDADMVAGYLRIYDKRTKKNVKLNGLPGSNKETHFKILKRREM